MTRFKASLLHVHVRARLQDSGWHDPKRTFWPLEAVGPRLAMGLFDVGRKAAFVTRCGLTWIWTAPIRCLMLRLIGVLLVCSGSFNGLQAQRATTVIVVGVADEESGAPIVDAIVQVPQDGRIARTNWLGEASLLVSRAIRDVGVRHVGYEPSSVTIRPTADSIAVIFRLRPSTASLDTVRIEGRRVPARLQEFETRRRLGIGRFLSDSVLEREGNHSLSLTLSMRFPGIRATPSPEGGHYLVESTRIDASGPRNPNKFSSVCKVDVYVDGTLTSDYDSFFPSDLAGAEFYTMGSAPPQFRRGTGACQVILLWTKY
jgi:hypothetical protein